MSSIIHVAVAILFVFGGYFGGYLLCRNREKSAQRPKQVFVTKFDDEIVVRDVIVIGKYKCIQLYSHDTVYHILKDDGTLEGGRGPKSWRWTE